AVADRAVDAASGVVTVQTLRTPDQVGLAGAVEVAHGDRQGDVSAELKSLVRIVLAIGQYSKAAIAVLQVYVKRPGACEANGDVQLAIAIEVAYGRGRYPTKAPRRGQNERRFKGTVAVS